MTEPIDGGVAHCVLQAARDQVERGWTVTVVSPADPGFVASLPAGANHRPLPLRPRPAGDRPRRPGVADLIRGMATIRDVVGAERPEVVHLHSSWAGLAGRLALRGKRRTFFQPHGWSFDALDGRVAGGARVWERFGARWATATICVSEQERTRGTEAGIRAAWQVIPNGVDVATWRPASSEERGAARRSLRLSAADEVAVCVGRLSPVKGQARLLDAWAAVVARVPDACLLLAGDGPDRPALEARKVPRVVFLGHVKDLATLYAAADVVVIPSESEGMSITMLEAMACGRTVVSTDVGGAAAALGADAGAVVPLHDRSALADAVAARLGNRDLAEREGADARRRVEQSFSSERATEALAALYAAS